MGLSKIVVIEGPSGAGKDSILQGLISKYPDIYNKPANITTREMRPGETQGNPYRFVNEKKFKKMLESGEVFEFTVRHGTYRGMSKKLIQAVIDDGKTPLINCDMIGVEALRGLGTFDLLTIFITAQKQDIEKRMIERGDSLDDRNKRLDDYDRHMQFEKNFDISVENKTGKLDNTIETVHRRIQKWKKC